jgi:hypothetical protein
LSRSFALVIHRRILSLRTHAQEICKKAKGVFKKLKKEEKLLNLSHTRGSKKELKNSIEKGNLSEYTKEKKNEKVFC